MQKMIGMICRMDKSGLGIQTKRLARLLKPDRILLIDSTPFNGSKQHPEWYKDYETISVTGFPTDMQIRRFMSGLDTVISCETFYFVQFTIVAKQLKVRTALIFNYEFLDWFRRDYMFMPVPDIMIQPSLWHLDEMQSRFGAVYLPTPIFADEFEDVQKANIKQSRRKFLFMNGKTAAEDRNGLESLYEAIELAKGDFTVTIKAQNDVKKHPDPRLIYDFSDPEDQKELYRGFDCLIQPRRYGGQTLSMTEALQCAMPVIMTNIDPNNKVLPYEWLLPSYKKGTLMTRLEIDVYAAEKVDFAYMLDSIDLGRKAKKKAVEIGDQYDAESLRAKYMEILT